MALCKFTSSGKGDVYVNPPHVVYVAEAETDGTLIVVAAPGPAGPDGASGAIALKVTEHIDDVASRLNIHYPL